METNPSFGKTIRNSLKNSGIFGNNKAKIPTYFSSDMNKPFANVKPGTPTWAANIETLKQNMSKIKDAAKKNPFSNVLPILDQLKEEKDPAKMLGSLKMLSSLLPKLSMQDPLSYVAANIRNLSDSLQAAVKSDIKTRINETLAQLREHMKHEPFSSEPFKSSGEHLLNLPSPPNNDDIREALRHLSDGISLHFGENPLYLQNKAIAAVRTLAISAGKLLDSLESKESGIRRSQRISSVAMPAIANEEQLQREERLNKFTEKVNGYITEALTLLTEGPDNSLNTEKTESLTVMATLVKGMRSSDLSLAGKAYIKLMDNLPKFIETYPEYKDTHLVSGLQTLARMTLAHRVKTVIENQFGEQLKNLAGQTYAENWDQLVPYQKLGEDLLKMEEKYGIPPEVFDMVVAENPVLAKALISVSDDHRRKEIGRKAIEQIGKQSVKENNLKKAQREIQDIKSLMGRSVSGWKGTRANPKQPYQEAVQRLKIIVYQPQLIKKEKSGLPHDFIVSPGEKDGEINITIIYDKIELRDATELKMLQQIERDPGEGQIGAGRFGKVVYARSEGKRSYDVLKTVKEVTPEMVDSTKNEVSHLKRELGNPYVVQLQDSFEIRLSPQATQPFLKLELAKQGNVIHLMQKLRSLSDTPENTLLRQKIILKVIKQVLQGLAQMHANGHVHCDLKSANLLVFDKGRIKITDLGSAMDKGSTGHITADTYYMSPEYINRDDVSVTEKIDSFTAGLILVELLSAYQGNSNYTDGRPLPVSAGSARQFAENFVSRKREGNIAEAYFNEVILANVPVLKKLEDPFMELLTKLLAPEDERLTPEEALKLPVFSAEKYAMTESEYEEVMEALYKRPELVAEPQTPVTTVPISRLQLQSMQQLGHTLANSDPENLYHTLKKEDTEEDHYNTSSTPKPPLKVDKNLTLADEEDPILYN